MSTPYPGPDPQHPQQPPYPSATGEPTHGPPYGPPAYGPPGRPPPAHGTPYSPDLRPVTVTVAAWITIVLSTLSIIAGIASIAGASPLVDYLRRHQNEMNLSASDMQDLGNAQLGFVVIGVVLILSSIVAIVVAVFVLKRQNWARITVVVLSGITALLGTVGALALIVGVVWLIGAVAVIILLFVGGANEWFSRPRRPPNGPGQPPYGQTPYGQNPYGPNPYGR